MRKYLYAAVNLFSEKLVKLVPSVVRFNGKLKYSSIFHSCFWLTFKSQSTAWHHAIWKRCAFLFPLFPTFLLSVPLLVVIWSYPEQGYNWATGHVVWLVRPPGTVYHWTFVRHRHYQRSNICSRRRIYSNLPTSVTNFVQSTSSKQCSDSRYVTAPYKMSFYYYYYYYYY